METKQRSITMFIALVAMLMGTKVMAQEAYAVLSDDSKTLTFRYDSSKSSYGDKAYDLNEGNNLPGWNGITTVETVVFEESFATVRPVSTCSWFDCFTNLTEFVGMEYLNTSEVTTMNSMFECCSKITNLDLSHFYTSKVTNMQDVFASCVSLKDINLHGFDTSNVTIMSRMFSGCVALETLNLGSFNTSSVTEMTMMFYGCGNLRTIYVSGGWSAPEAGGYGMFIQCGKIIGGEGTTYDDNHTAADYAHIDGLNGKPGYLTVASVAYAVLSDDGKTLTFYYDGNKDSYGENAYDLNEENVCPGWIDYSNPDKIQKVVFTSSFQNARPVSTYDWFYNQPSLTEIVDIQYLNTSEVENMSEMFFMCSGLKELDLSGFDTQNVTDMSLMFSGCHSLTSLDLSSFNTSNVRNMNCMFDGCTKLKTITVRDNWNTANVESSDNMFTGCSSIVGGAGTQLDENHLDKAYAHIDGGKSDPGYLTALSYGITVSGKAVTFANKYDVLGNETVNYDDDLNILTLIDANVTSISIASTAPNDLHVNVIGVCTVQFAKGNAFTTSIAKTTIEGNGKLTILSSNGIGIKINRKSTAGLLVKDVDLEVGGNQAGIAGSTDLNNKFCSYLVFENTNCIVGSLQGETGSVADINGLECIRCSMTAGEFVAHKVAANPMRIERSGGISTDIDAIDNGQLTIDKSLPLYNLNGQRVSHPVKGQIYIQNGRKIKF